MLFYIKKGNEVYATKDGYEGVQKSLYYFDSAQQIAETEGDSIMLAQSDFAKGLVYDAWNKEPEKTIEYYNRAANYYSRMPGRTEDYWYLKQLVAHAYDKIGDSVNTIRVINELYDEIEHYDSIEKLDFVPKLAHISSEVGNYKLADKILNRLTKREWIKNDSLSYNYLDFYYLTKARVDVHLNKNCETPYRDSVKIVFAHAKNTFDSNYFSYELSRLYAACQNYKEAYNYYLISTELYEKINRKEGIGNMQNTLLKAELGAEKRRLEYAQKIERLREYSGYTLIGILAVIYIFAFNFYRQKNYIINSLRNLRRLMHCWMKKLRKWIFLIKKFSTV